jgi:transposase
MNQPAKRLGTSQSSVGNWVRRHNSTAGSATPSVRHSQQSMSELEAENARLRRELANAKVDSEIVNKAAYFARESR